MKKHVLFICTGNSCRSQLAEALVNAKYGDAWQAISAGIRPAQRTNPNALQVLDEIDIQTSGSPTQHVNEYRDTQFDLVVTLCDSAKDAIPDFAGMIDLIHLSIPDPFEATGSTEEVLQHYRRARDMIYSAILPILGQHPTG